MSERIVHPACRPDCTHELASPGPNPIPKPLPTQDPQDYPVFSGPAAYLPTEPGPAVWRADTGPIPAPQPADLFKRDPIVPAVVHPQPLVPARAAHEVEVPSAARTVRKLAEANGWQVRCTYALGWVLGSRGDTRALTHSVALRMQMGPVMGRDTRMIVAVWTVKETEPGLLDRSPVAVPVKGWKFDLAYGWGGGTPHHKLSAAALKESIKEA